MQRSALVTPAAGERPWTGNVNRLDVDVLRFEFGESISEPCHFLKRQVALTTIVCFRTTADSH